jgi:hypothetical protein
VAAAAVAGLPYGHAGGSSAPYKHK